MKYQTIVVRGDAEVIARVEADVINPSLLLHHNFLVALRKGITSWVQLTDEGKKAFEYSSEDFNIGDLSGYLEDRNLQGLLFEVGISNLSISIYSQSEGNPDWVYDTHLIDQDEL